MNLERTAVCFQFFFWLITELHDVNSDCLSIRVEIRPRMQLHAMLE